MMLSSPLALLVVALIPLALNVVSVDCAEELRILAPAALAQQFNYNSKIGVLRETPALFGQPNYQTGVSGIVYLSVPSTACSPLNATAMNVPSSANDAKILYVDRGVCSFKTKVRYAGVAGFQAVIVGDTFNEVAIPYMADDGTMPEVSTPSVMISYSDANILRSFLSSSSSGTVTASMEFSLPNPDDKVEIDLYTISVDPIAAQFKHMFSKSIRELGAAVSFTPTFYTISGAPIHCTDPSATCGNQCSNGGRYCAVDPERNTTNGLSGRDVLQENLRQWCLWNVSRTVGIPQYKWFDYVTAFDAACSSYCPTPSDPSVNPECLSGFSSTCSYSTMLSLGLPSSLVSECVLASGGSDTSSFTNSVFDAQIAAVSQNGIFFIPTLTINKQPYRGTLNCAVPTDLTCAPLSAICSGFLHLPEACLTSAGCDVGEIRDVCGVCGGDGAIDACGVCASMHSPAFNASCKGCDGVPNSHATYDACGVCSLPGKSTCPSSGPFPPTPSPSPSPSPFPTPSLSPSTPTAVIVPSSSSDSSSSDSANSSISPGVAAVIAILATALVCGAIGVAVWCWCASQKSKSSDPYLSLEAR